MKKIILYIFLAFCLLGVIPLALSLISQTSNSSSSSSISSSSSSVTIYSLTATSDEHSTIVVYDSNDTAVTSLQSGQEYTISVSVDEHYSLSSLKVNNVAYQNNSIIVPTSNITINSVSALQTFTLTKTGSNCTISVLNSSSESVSSLTYGQTYTISVTASSGYGISSITMNNQTIQNNSTFIASQNTTIGVSVVQSLVGKTWTPTKNVDKAPSGFDFSEENGNSESYSLTFVAPNIDNGSYVCNSIWFRDNDYNGLYGITYSTSVSGDTFEVGSYSCFVAMSGVWQLDSSTTLSRYTIQITGGNDVLNADLIAWFEEYGTFSSTSQTSYTLTTTGNNCTISVTNSDNESVSSLISGQTYTISVSANSGYQIDSITLNGTTITNNRTFIASQNTIISVVSSPISYTLTTSGNNCTISVLNSNSESVRSLISGQSYTISVIASSGYQVDSITLNGTTISNNSTFTASQNTIINVTTSLITYTLTTSGSNCTISVLNSSNESVSSLTYGQTYTISVTARSGYQVDSITLNGTSVSNNSTFTASQNTTIGVVTSAIVQGYNVSISTIDYYDINSSDYYIVQYSTDNGQTWNILPDSTGLIGTFTQIKFKIENKGAGQCADIRCQSLGLDLYTSGYYTSETVESQNFVLTQDITDVVVGVSFD